MIGAGAVWAQGNKLTAEFVPHSLRIWEATAVGKDEDYHGNFDAELFELWFEELCYNSMMRYGSVRIHMDGAKYHLRNLNPVPTTSWRKDAIQQWLTTHGVEWSANMLKAELLGLAKAQKAPRNYACVQIAANYGHQVLITPPYHPELQPIEIIWAVVKNAVAASPPRSMKELIAQLNSLFKKKVTSKTWVGAYRKAQGFENTYWAAQTAEEEAEDETVDSDASESEATEYYSF
ncbi:hypothetical protein P43SY_011604 [Pythium insidiosum]|uniref:Tc1-like transposase DDE domain-containing protein n=1 Tax=Pythium insidiosum TaxID=114742 RepID=A0AAD5L5N0_PYTIN|nr:hypothetical protein P43SY_011604 [Pythium insidiosum]